MSESQEKKPADDEDDDNNNDELKHLNKAWGKLKRVNKAWSLLGIVLTILATGIGGYIQHILQPYFTVWQIIWTTLPLTAAVAIYVFLVLRDVKVSYSAVCLIIVGTFIASVITGVSGGTRVYDYLYHPEYRCVSVNFEFSAQNICQLSGYSAPSGTANLIWGILSGYIHIYGIVGAIRSFFVGCCLAYSLAILAEPSPKREEDS